MVSTLMVSAGEGAVEDGAESDDFLRTSVAIEMAKDGKDSLCLYDCGRAKVDSILGSLLIAVI